MLGSRLLEIDEFVRDIRSTLVLRHPPHLTNHVIRKIHHRAALSCAQLGDVRTIALIKYGGLNPVFAKRIGASVIANRRIA